MLNNSILRCIGRHHEDSHCERVNGSTSYIDVYVPDIIPRHRACPSFSDMHEETSS